MTCKRCGKARLSRFTATNYVGRASTPLRMYRCPHGNGWHVTSKKPWTTRRALAPDADQASGEAS